MREGNRRMEKKERDGRKLEGDRKNEERKGRIRTVGSRGGERYGDG